MLILHKRNFYLYGYLLIILLSKGPGPIRPQIGPTTFSRRKDLETIQLDRFQLGEHSDAVFDTFDGIFNGRYGPPFYSTLVYIFTSYLVSTSTISQQKQNTCS